MGKAKPFIKWVGGKGQLIAQLDESLPANLGSWQELTYVEPFVGGGAMLFHMLQKYDNIKHAVINDINPDLTTCYKVVRDNPYELLHLLSNIQDEYYKYTDYDSKKEFYLYMRDKFNSKPSHPIENTMLFIFLNRTCFNGLYRVNKKGKFNVPCGKYERPCICDEETILADSNLLKGVEILTGDFEQTLSWMNSHTFVYFDPPYRPLSNTSSFNDYAKEPFNDDEQIRLKHFCDELNKRGVYFMLSNSDCLSHNQEDSFFDDLFVHYDIRRVWANRSVNANAQKRGKLTEILVRNYASCQLLHKSEAQLILAL